MSGVSGGVAGAGGGMSKSYLRDRLGHDYYTRGSRPSIVSSSTTAGRRTISISKTPLVVGTTDLTIPAINIDLDIAANWDSAAQNMAVAANRAGSNIYVYATADKLIVSPNSTVPTGYTAENSRKILGCHFLCLSAGTLAGHPLTGFLTGDILPTTLWDLIHRPTCNPAGMFYSDLAGIWADIYLQSGTGTATASANGATITDTRTWNDHVDDLAAVGKRLLWDDEFQIIAEGSNQRTNISGGADPVTTGGHVDTAGRRMISNFGAEDCCGAMNQWLLDQSYQNDSSTYNGVFGYYTLPGNKGSLYRQGTLGDVKLVAGGHWSAGTYCGSRSRFASYYRWLANSSLAARGCARSHAGNANT